MPLALQIGHPRAFFVGRRRISKSQQGGSKVHKVPLSFVVFPVCVGMGMGIGMGICK